MEKLEHKALKADTLEKYATDLTQLAQQNKLDPVIGRATQIERVMQILCKRRKNNPCLIGDPGVGKTAVAEGLAQCISDSNVPYKLLNRKVFSLDISRLIAGASNRGEFEERLTKVVDEVKGSDGEIMLFIDEVHTLVGAGSGGQALDAANILKPALAKGELNCIAATTLDEYRKYIEKDPALKRRFESVDVPEPSVEDAIEILIGLSKKYEAHHRVIYSYEALTAAARLSKRYMSEYFLPDKAIDLIDEAGARVQLSKSQSSLEIPIVTDIDIGRIISSRTGIPLQKLSPSASLKLLHMKNTMKESIIGQDDAVEAVCRALCRDAAGVRDPNRPIASFLFTGPAGVGKTEVAKVIAQQYFGSKEAIVRIDMSEYMEKHTVSRLYGSPPGYIGHDEGGQLAEAIRRHPYSLVLFDEIEKAHRDVMNVMLQILDDGRLTDSKGRTVDFKNTLIILTSNIGGSLIAQPKIGRSFEEVKNLVAEELKKQFLPEFLNRLDEVIVFKQLSKSQLREIVDVRLKEVCERIEMEKSIQVEITQELKDKLVEEGFNPRYGARPLKRAIVSHFEDKLADEERLMQLVDEVRSSDGETILFIEEAHTLFAAGPGELTAASILKPAFTNGMLKCIACTTKDEYAKYVEKHPALKRRLQLVEVPEPSLAQAIEILKGHHHVIYSKKALIVAAGLSSLYISEYCLPDKAMDLLDEAGARVCFQMSHQSKFHPVITEMEMMEESRFHTAELLLEMAEIIMKENKERHGHYSLGSRAKFEISQAVLRMKHAV